MTMRNCVLALFIAAALGMAPSTRAAETAPAAAAQPAADAAAEKPNPPAKLDAESPEGRAVARWQFIISGKPEKAYDFLSPGARSAKSREQWAKEVRERPVHWKDVLFIDKACDSEESCKVRLEVQYEAPLVGAPGGVLSSPGFLIESWLKVGKQWFFVPKEYAAGGLR